jgi:hypothetical protein
MVCTLKRLEKLGEYMNTRLERSDLPELRDFLDNLPKKPCPSKLPEEYCKLCRRLNGEVAHYCETKKPPSLPPPEALEERTEPEIEEMEEHRVPHRVPILERPTYREGDTSLEFVPSDKSIEEAKKSLPRFIPVHRGPRPFRPLEEPGLEEFETFTMERPSIFRSPSSLVEGEEDMMFTLLSDEGAIEVTPLEIDEEASIPSETIFESSDGVVETVEISEGAMDVDIERELPVFEFIDEGEGEIVEAEIVEAEIVEEGSFPEEYAPQPGVDETEESISDLAEEISDMTEHMEKEHYEEGLRRREVAFKPEGVIPPRRVPRPSKKMKPKAEVAKIERKIPRKPRKKRKVKRKLRLKKVKEKKIEKIRKDEEITEPLMEKPEEGKHRLESLEGIIPSEEIKTLAELLKQKPEVKPREETLKERMEPEPSPEMLPPPEEPTEKIDADLYMCPSCGSFLSSTATKCTHCGFDFEAEEEVEMPPEEEEPGERLEPEPSEEPKPPEEIKPKDEILEEKPEEELKEEELDTEPSPEMIPPEEEPKEEKIESEPGPELIPPEEEPKEEKIEPEPSPEMIPPEEEPKEEKIEPEPSPEIIPPEEELIEESVELEPSPEMIPPEEEPEEEKIEPEPSEVPPPPEEIRFEIEMEGEEKPKEEEIVEKEAPKKKMRKKRIKKKKKMKMKKVKLKRAAK